MDKYVNEMEKELSMGNFEYKRATLKDIDELVKTRIIVLRAANKLPDDVDMSVVEQESQYAMHPATHIVRCNS